MVNHFLYWLLQVSSSSNYDRERNKLSSDPSLSLLTTKERGQVFEECKKERTEERGVREDEFRMLMEEAGLHGK
jgi:hypothetical protein